MSDGKAILVIGGGVIGLCTAYYALQKGHRVTVVERGAPDHDCCSLGNAGLVVPSHFVPLAAPGMIGLGLRMMLNPEGPFCIRPRWSGELLRWGWKFARAATAEQVARAAPLLLELNLASRRCYEELAEQNGNAFGLVKKGLLMLCKSEHGLEEEKQLAEHARRLDFPVEILSPEETARLDPGIQRDIAGAVYFPLDCHLNPLQLIVWLAHTLQAQGVQFLWSTEVQGWKMGGECIEAVQTSQGDLSADEYVLAAGSWSAALARGLGLRLPLQPGKGYSLTLPAPPQLPTIASVLVEARVAVTPMGSSLRFAGTMEITGMDQSVNPARVNGIIKSILAYLPAFTPENFRTVSAWNGLRPCSPDGLPYLGRPACYRNLCVATGHAMMGVSLGPITGKLVAEILSEDQPTLDIRLLNPDRYA